MVAGAAYDRYEGVHASGCSIVVLTGSPSGLSASRHQTLNSHAVYSHDHDGDGFVLAVARLASDGYADLVVGAPTARVGSRPGAGVVHVLRGSSHGGSVPTTSWGPASAERVLAASSRNRTGRDAGPIAHVRLPDSAPASKVADIVAWWLY
jgi:hypothetical protein